MSTDKDTSQPLILLIAIARCTLIRENTVEDTTEILPLITDQVLE